MFNQLLRLHVSNGQLATDSPKQVHALSLLCYAVGRLCRYDLFSSDKIACTKFGKGSMFMMTRMLFVCPFGLFSRGPASLDLLISYSDARDET